MRKFRISSAVAAAGAAVLAPGWSWAQQQTERYAGDHSYHMMEGGAGWYGMVFGPLFMILVLAVVVAVAVLLVRWLGGPWHSSPPPHGQPARTSLDILKERYARGEIDKEEFEERRRTLGE